MTWLLLAVGAALAAIVVYAQWRDRRIRRHRRNLEHLTGAREWWGKR